MNTLSLCYQLMVCTYKRRKGSRKYCDYYENKLKTACLDVLEGRLLFRAASRTHGITVGTLHNKCSGKHPSFYRHPTALSESEEKELCKVVHTCEEWSFLLDILDLRDNDCAVFTRYWWVPTTVQHPCNFVKLQFFVAFQIEKYLHSKTRLFQVRIECMTSWNIIRELVNARLL